jgi:hypothetical protein
MLGAVGSYQASRYPIHRNSKPTILPMNIRTVLEIVTQSPSTGFSFYSFTRYGRGKGVVVHFFSFLNISDLRASFKNCAASEAIIIILF